MELWIARDKDGNLSLFNEKPVIDVYYPCRYSSYEDWSPEGTCLELEKDLFPQVTWENSPQRVRIEIIK